MTSAAPGVTFLDHTADVGIDVEAASTEQLFHRAALGMLALLHGLEDDSTGPERPDVPTPSFSSTQGGADAAAEGGEPSSAIAVSGDGWGAVLLAWLREILFLHETRNRDYTRADFHRLDPTGLEATVRTVPSAPAVREIKGVTYHELAVERTDHGWKGRVIFDV